MAHRSSKNVHTPTTNAELPARFEKMAAAYVTVASAVAGAALMSASTAEAKIVYTQKTVSITSSYAIDLNGDGISDFTIDRCFNCLPHGSRLQVLLSASGNEVLQGTFPGYAADLPRGAAIGPKQVFTSRTSNYGGVFMAGGSAYGTAYSFSDGPWIGAKNRFLGLKFLINGQVHFGWARLTVAKGVARVVLTGFAYETIPNKSLQAGQTTEPPADGVRNEASSSALPAPGPSLGMLASGADAIDIWRKRDPVSTLGGA